MVLLLLTPLGGLLSGLQKLLLDGIRLHFPLTVPRGRFKIRIFCDGLGGVGRSVVFANGTFLATGSGSTGTMCSSVNGRNWRLRPL